LGGGEFWDPILPFLYLGNERDAQNVEILLHLNVGHVLNVTTHLPLYHAESGQSLTTIQLATVRSYNGAEKKSVFYGCCPLLQPSCDFHWDA
uniref:Uncharacterized protein n=1 Tax=Naja naja TaxID=35670 RepID=A0A8C6XAL3_NAJNA